MTIDWSGVFVPSLGLAEVILRGSIMYLALFVILRFIARRQAGQFGPADLLVIVLIADAAQNGLGKDYGSVTEGVVLVLQLGAKLAGWELKAEDVSKLGNGLEAGNLAARVANLFTNDDAGQEVGEPDPLAGTGTTPAGESVPA